MDRKHFRILHRTQGIIIQNQIALMDALSDIIWSMARDGRGDEFIGTRKCLGEIRANAKTASDTISSFCDEASQL